MLLGHSSIAVTESRYAFLNADAVAESAFGGTIDGTCIGGVINLAEQKQRLKKAEQ